MATTTPNFGWAVPTSTDLVKDGAVAIETLGDSIDASLVDLKGGTTGQVLSKTSATDMDFTWVTASSGSSYVAGKNGIINSAFDVWQRSTSATFAGAVIYPATDRWYGVSLAGSPTCTMSRQTADTTNLTYGMRFGRNSGQTATGDIYVGNTFESSDSKRFAGQTVTLSFYVKAGANAPSTLQSQIRTGTGTDQTAATLFSAGWTGGTANTQNNTVTTTMTRYSQTVTLGSTVNQIMIAFTYASTGTAGANEWFQIEGVQFEIASAASAFSRNTGTLQGELAACQRYYQKSYAQGTAPGTNNIVAGMVTSKVSSNTVANNERYATVFLKQTMRTSPTLTIRPYGTASNTARVSDSDGTDLAANSGTVTALTADGSFNVYNASGGTLTTTNLAVIFQYEASAEL